MTDILTKEEKEKLTETRLWLERLLEHRPGDAMKRSVAEEYFKDLLHIIDRLIGNGKDTSASNQERFSCSQCGHKFSMAKDNPRPANSIDQRSVCPNCESLEW